VSSGTIKCISFSSSISRSYCRHTRRHWQLTKLFRAQVRGHPKFDKIQRSCGTPSFKLSMPQDHRVLFLGPPGQREALRRSVVDNDSKHHDGARRRSDPEGCRRGRRPFAVLMGVMTASFGGILRDMLCAEVLLILRPEISVHDDRAVPKSSRVLDACSGFTEYGRCHAAPLLESADKVR
jgi:hypothetical protein